MITASLIAQGECENCHYTCEVRVLIQPQHTAKFVAGATGQMIGAQWPEVWCDAGGVKCPKCGHTGWEAATPEPESSPTIWERLED